MVRKISERYVVVYIPKELAAKAKPFLRDYGYVHLGDLIRDLLRRWVEERERMLWGKG